MMTLPLSGIRVLDLTRLLPGGICTMLLADLGADVIKVESPDGGDYARLMPPMVGDQGAIYRATNRGKRSIVINLKDPRGQDVLHKLVEGADVLVEGFRPGVMARMRCDHDTLRAVNPRLVYCSISGWGKDGPYAAHSGHDLNYASIGGLVGEMNQPQPLGGQVADIGGAYIAVAGILAALLRRERTGEGSYVDAALYEAGLLFGAVPLIEAMTAHRPDSPIRGALSGRQACYNVYPTRDGQYVALAALEPKFWANFCNAVERPDLVDDYLSPSRQQYLIAEVAEIFAMRTADEWTEQLIPADCCFSLVNTPEESLTDPHVQARAMLGVNEDGTPFLRSPIRLNNDQSNLSAPPKAGEHTLEVLHEAGLTNAEIAVLREEHVIRVHK
jgi:crotonobetainyl-CoA:carnitine CoA-transferase CaiB-like acyl-CoA transferase